MGKNPIEAGSVVEITRADGMSLKFRVQSVQWSPASQVINMTIVPEVEYDPEEKMELVAVPTLDDTLRSRILPLNPRSPERLPPGWHSV